MNYLDFGNKPKGASCWFFLHPYVYVSVKKDRAILYNTLNHGLLEYERESPIFQLIKRLDIDSNRYVIKLKADEIDIRISEFINQIRNLYFGDVIDTSLSTRKPIQLKPILNLQKTLDFLTSGDEKNRILFRDDIPDYLNIITLYTNNDCKQSCSICRDAYKQFLCCHKKDRDKKQLTLENFSALINQVRNSNLHKFNIIGGNLFSYPMLEELAEYLNRVGVIKAYFVHYLNIEDRPDIFKLIRNGKNKMTITVHFPVEVDIFNKKMEILEKSQITNKFNFQFVVQTEKDIDRSEALISEFQVADYRFIPYFNGDNMDFFRQNIFINRGSILESQPEMHDILVRTVLNTSDFKKLIILSDRSIHANLNNPKIGTLGEDHIMDLVYKELHGGKSWTKVRKNVTPCKSCAYNTLCPPISNYEYVIGQYNLCNIM